MNEDIFMPGPGTARDFRRALGRFATGITIVTTQSSQGPVGLTANSFTSVSLDPPLVLWCPARTSRRHDAFVGAEHFAIHVLADDQHELMRSFVAPDAGFDLPGIAYSDEGTPLLPGCLARFECLRAATHDGGDHTIILGRVLRVALRKGAPLIFSGGQYGAFQPIPG
ncbi:flavin reductase family protein [Halodurantibacterium flavum]|uniref:Flavin reductase family protein n=1 Tax=Halodurantibacterium flavum TaxID=1382802 RepID=A0ABW4S4Y9_9RHOB